MKTANIFFRALIIVLLHTSNVVFISSKMYAYSVLISAGISIMWTLNVKDIAVANWKDRISYVLGGICGTAISLYGLQDLLPK